MKRIWMGLALPLALALPQDDSPADILGLTPTRAIFLGEGPTNQAQHPPSTGTLRAVMLFAQFPDGEEDLSMEQLHERLVPEAVKALAEASYGRFELKVEPHYEWFPMKKDSTDPGYDCSKHATHKSYVDEVVAAADEKVDFGLYSLIYVVANKAPGVHNSPTFNAHGGAGFRADGNGIRHAVTFGNDIRGNNWGWQTLVHETGHVLGLPDLYSYSPRGKAYKDVHPFTGSWSPMGFQCHARHDLAWHKHKLGWLDAEDIGVWTAGKRSFELAHIAQDSGMRALVIRLSDTEAIVADVRHLSDEHPEPGVLIYSVSVDKRSGQGPIQVLPCTPDDDVKRPRMARKYVGLYDALYRDGSVFTDSDARITIKVAAAGESSFVLEVSRR